jgi:hypothetical protein
MKTIMKKLVLLSVMGLSPFAALAGDALAPGAQILPDAQQIIVPAHAFRIEPSEFNNFKRTYELSDGNEVTLSGSTIGNKMYATTQDGVRHEIVAISKNSFVAKDGTLKITIDLDQNGFASGEALVANPARASNTATLAMASKSQ